MFSSENWDHPFSKYAKSSEKLTFLTAQVRIRGIDMLGDMLDMLGQKIGRPYYMDDAFQQLCITLKSTEIRGDLGTKWIQC